ncbi:hypothetical protein HAX54_008417 [Datura stramonium]|uniref:Uncharacterized protein n=1 Tax=Datura stramonium TaxID=4076 RepID=A0ABS8RVF5_DATST|nr:hypothetical protein [Datura stramonium]
MQDLMDEHISEEPELISKLEHTSELKNFLLPEGGVTNAVELNPTETSYQRYSSQSSSSSLAEVRKGSVDKEGERRSSLEEIMGHVEQDVISRQTSFDGPDFHITSTSHVESETGAPPTLVERTISFVERESEENSQDIEKSLPHNEEILAPADDSAFVEGGRILTKSSAEEDIGYQEGTIEHAQQQISSSRFDADTHIVSQLAVEHTVESLSTSSEYQNIHHMGDEQHLRSQSSVTDAQTEVDEKQISVGYQYASIERSFSQCEEELAYSDKSIDEQPSEDREVKEPPAILVESIEEASTTETLNVSEIHDLDNGIPIISSQCTPNSISNLHEVVEAPRGAGLSGLKNMILEENDNQIKVLENYVLPPEAADFHHDEQYIVEETDGIEDIDEVLLYELDTVGDFSIKELGSSQNEFERQSPIERVYLHSTVLILALQENLLKEKFTMLLMLDQLKETPEDSGTGPSDPRTKLNLDAQEIVLEMPIAEAHNSVFEVENSKSTQTGVTEVPQEERIKRKLILVCQC